MRCHTSFSICARRWQLKNFKSFNNLCFPFTISSVKLFSFKLVYQKYQLYVFLYCELSLWIHACLRQVRHHEATSPVLFLLFVLRQDLTKLPWLALIPYIVRVSLVLAILLPQPKYVALQEGTTKSASLSTSELGAHVYSTELCLIVVISIIKSPVLTHKYQLLCMLCIS